MNHKEKMKNLKKHDPISYYELQDDPTGSNYSRFGGCLFILLLFLGALIIGLLMTIDQ